MIIAVNFPKKEAWKKSGLQRDSNPWPLRYRCVALPTKLWSHTLGARSIYWVHISFHLQPQFKMNYFIYSYFEKGCREKCTRQSWKALWEVLSSLFFKEIWKNWHERPWKCVCECSRKATKVSSTATVVRNSVLIISHVTFRDCRVHIFSDNLPRNSCILHIISKQSPSPLHHTFLLGRARFTAQPLSALVSALTAIGDTSQLLAYSGYFFGK